MGVAEWSYPTGRVEKSARTSAQMFNISFFVPKICPYFKNFAFSISLNYRIFQIPLFSYL